MHGQPDSPVPVETMDAPYHPRTLQGGWVHPAVHRTPGRPRRDHAESPVGTIKGT